MNLHKICWLTFFSIFILSPSVAKDDLERAGDLFQVIIPAYALGMAANEPDFTGVKQFTYSYLAMQGTVSLLKYTVKASRPNHAPGSNQDSFPSGHTAAAFTGASFIHHRYGIRQALIPYLLASGVAYSRIQADKHYFHDTVAGAALASLSTYIFVTKENKPLPVNILATPRSASLQFSLEF